MKKNTLNQVKDLIIALGRENDLKVAMKKYGNEISHDYYVITSSKPELCYEVTMSKASGFLHVRTFEGSRLPYYEVEMILSLDKTLERMRNND